MPYAPTLCTSGGYITLYHLIDWYFMALQYPMRADHDVLRLLKEGMMR